MVRKIIIDKNLIKYLTNRSDNVLVIEYNLRNKRAWFKTESMIKKGYKFIESDKFIDFVVFNGWD